MWAEDLHIEDTVLKCAKVPLEFLQRQQLRLVLAKSDLAWSRVLRCCASSISNKQCSSCLETAEPTDASDVPEQCYIIKHLFFGAQERCK